MRESIHQSGGICEPNDWEPLTGAGQTEHPTRIWLTSRLPVKESPTNSADVDKEVIQADHILGSSDGFSLPMLFAVAKTLAQLCRRVCDASCDVTSAHARATTT